MDSLKITQLQRYRRPPGRARAHTGNGHPDDRADQVFDNARAPAGPA